MRELADALPSEDPALDLRLFRCRFRDGGPPASWLGRFAVSEVPGTVRSLYPRWDLLGRPRLPLALDDMDVVHVTNPSGVAPVRGQPGDGYLRLRLDNSTYCSPQTSMALNGTISKNAALQVRVNSNDLHELETISAAFRAPDSAAFGLYGQAVLNATVSGSTRSPQVSGQLTAENLKVRGSEWKVLRANISASPSQVRVDNGELDSATRGKVTFKLVTALQEWAFTKTSQFQLQFAASQMNAADLTKAAGSTAPVDGTISADIAANGSQLAPVGHGTITLASARIAGEPVKNVELQFHGTGNQVNANLKVDLPAGSANATLQYEPASQAYVAELHARGIKLDQLETVKARNLQLQGVLDVNANGRGTVQNPQMQAVIEVPQLQIRDQVIKGLKLQTNVANQVANFTLDSDVINTHAGGHGTIQLTGDYVADLSLDTQAIPLAPLFALYAPSQAENMTGQTEVHATLRGPLKDKTRAGSASRDPTACGELQKHYSDGCCSPNSRGLCERSS